MKETLINSHEILKAARLSAIDTLSDTGKPFQSALSAYFEAITIINKAAEVEPYLSKFYRDKINEARREARELLRIEKSRDNRHYPEMNRCIARYIALLERN